MNNLRNFRSTLLLPVLLAVAHVVTAYPYYQDRIPNGDEVYSPCNTTMKWKGVGHILIGGGGSRNPFGIAFAANGHVSIFNILNQMSIIFTFICPIFFSHISSTSVFYKILVPV